MKNLAICLRTSKQFDGDRTVSRKPYLVDFFHHQLTETQNGAIRIKKYSKFLIGSLQEGDELATKILIAHKFFKELSKIERYPVFIEAAKNGRLHAMKAMYKRCYHIPSRSVFRFACGEGLTSVVQSLVSIGATRYNQDEGFLKACEKGQISIVRLLKNRIQILTLQQGFVLSCATSQVFILRFLLKERETIRPAIGQGYRWACKNGHSACVDLLKDHPHLSVNSRGAGFGYLCQGNNEPLVKTMMNDPLITEKLFHRAFLRTTDRNIIQLLMHDSRLNCDSIFEKFVLGCRDNPLFVELLMNHKKLHDFDRLWGFQQACAVGNEASIRLLGSHPDIKETYLKKASERARSRGEGSIATLLQDELQRRSNA